MIGRRRAGIVTRGDFEKRIASDLIEKTRFEDLGQGMRGQELKRAESFHGGQIRASNIPVHASEGVASRHERQPGLNQSLPEYPRHDFVRLEDFVGPVALVAAKEFIAAVAGKE